MCASFAVTSPTASYSHSAKVLGLDGNALHLPAYTWGKHSARESFGSVPAVVPWTPH